MRLAAALVTCLAVGSAVAEPTLTLSDTLGSAPATVPSAPSAAAASSATTAPAAASATNPAPASQATVPGSLAPTLILPPAAPTSPLSNAPLAPAGVRITPEPTATEPAVDPNAPPIAVGDLWHRMRLGFQLGDFEHPVLAQWEEFYATRPELIRTFADRGSRYLFHIVEAIEARGLPTEIALIPVIESAFNPKAYSRAHASGLWQFIPSTGKVYGLNQTFWYDNRRDIIAATNAALDYLQRLRGMFNSWELAFAAYNCGEGCVARAIARNQKAGLPTHFAALNLPNETRLYVPKLMAVKNIISSPASYGVELTNVDNQPYFARIAAPQMDVQLAARFAEMPVEEFIALNPSFTRPVVKSDHGHILLPRDRVDLFNLNLARHTHPLVNWGLYSARKGEVVANIAKRYGMTVAQLRASNGFREKKGRLLYATTLLVPQRGAAAPRAEVSVAEVEEETPKTAPHPAVQQPRLSVQHVVRNGETLSQIAERHGTTVQQLQAWNGLRGSKLSIGQRLITGYRAANSAATANGAAASGPTMISTAVRSAAPAARAPAAVPARSAFYTVRNGDNLSVIAGRSGVAVQTLLKLNRLTERSVLQPGMKLRVS